MLKKFIPAFVIPTLLLSACGATSGVRQEIEPQILGHISRTDQQYRTMEEAESVLDAMPQADLIISLDERSLRNEMINDLKKRLWAANVPGTKAATIRNISMSLDAQAVDLKAQFIVHLKDPDMIFKGYIKGLAAPAFQGNVLYFYPAFNEIIFEDIERDPITLAWSEFDNPLVLSGKLQAKYNQAVAEKISHPVLRKFLANLNNMLNQRPLSLPITLTPVVPKKINQLVNKQNGLTINGGSREFVIKPLIKSGLFHINKQRLVLLAKLDTTTAGRSGSVIFNPGGSRDIQLNTFERNYQKFTRQVDKTIAESFFGGKGQSQNGTRIMMRKGFIAEQLGQTLYQPNTCVSYQAKEYATDFSRKLRVNSSSLPDCAKLEQDCDQGLRQCKAQIPHCTEACSDNYGEHQCSCSGKTDAEEQKCEISELPACQAGQTAKHRACEVRNLNCTRLTESRLKDCSTQQTACLANNKQARQACSAKRNALTQSNGKLEFTEINGEASVHGIYAQACIQSVEFNANLSALTVHTVMRGVATFNSSTDINSKGNNHLECAFNQRPTATIDAGITRTAAVPSALNNKQNGDLINITTRITTPSITAVSSPTPQEAMFAKPDTRLTCTLQGLSAINATSREITDFIDPAQSTSLLSGQITIKPETFTLEFDLKPLAIKFTDKEAVLKPVWQKHSIVYQ
ncbi:MAG: hypothetical protein OEZ39_18535 [Gammaproteobacteria bacterium]|nr:hypothetical protein [Gammaproteobacteria bacterium]MDH5653864.1 hypothetical protein [Gammaproteobacteria bacterium]